MLLTAAAKSVPACATLLQRTDKLYIPLTGPEPKHLDPDFQGKNNETPQNTQNICYLKCIQYTNFHIF